ncbi:MAG: carboxypeptidase regulatory-like domain-containing protein [Acidobacteria bacterium]|nr:carboxypeptidase regulatory-like domain-containing protein [Acidobacteriota bacterium]
MNSLRDRGIEGRHARRCFSFIVSLLMVGLVSIAVLAQRATGTISGRVITEDGQPIPHAKVRIVGVGGIKKALSGLMEIVTDAGGNFQADRLDPAPYSITATAPGYVLIPDGKSEQFGSGSARYAHVGETVTIRMLRGGVITGRVLNSAGEPVVGITVEANRLRDESGRPVNDQLNSAEMILGRQTDDRGIYRIYGLAPGTYVIGVGSGMLGFSIKPTPFSGRAKIYYPSATRDTAVEVTVRSGDETGGIDIRYRVETGAAISGKITGAPVGGEGLAAMTTSFVALTKAGSDILMGTSVVSPLGNNTGYSFYGLLNGEYEVTAYRPDLQNASVMASAPRRVTINGRDVTGIDLKLEAMASISGTVAVEKLVAPPEGQKCETGRESYLDEIVLQAKPNDPNQKSLGALSMFGVSMAAAPDDKGAFTLNGLKAGQYFLDLQLPDEHWFVKSVQLPSAPAANPAAREAGRNGVTLKSGEKVSNLTVTLGEGAAGLKGKVTTTGKLPSRLRVHLLPAEPEAKDDVLRFAEIRADDGFFAFTNVAPGKYLLVVRTITEAEQTDKPTKPAAWDAAERARLRKEAEAANATIELKACQRVTDFPLRWVK